MKSPSIHLCIVLCGLAWICAMMPGCASNRGGDSFPPTSNLKHQASTMPSPPVRLARTLGHTSLVLRRIDLRAHWPGVDTILPPTGEWIEFSMGDQGYWLAEERTVGVQLGSILTPGPALISVEEFLPIAPCSTYFAQSAVYRLRPAPSPAAFARLAAWLRADFALDSAGRARFVAPGFGMGGRLFLSRQRYHLFNTCNNWTRKALAAGGWTWPGPWTITSGQLCQQAATWLEPTPPGEQ